MWTKSFLVKIWALVVAIGLLAANAKNEVRVISSKMLKATSAFTPRFDVKLSRVAAEELIQSADTRGALYKAIGLLARHQGHDVANASLLIELILDMQITDSSSPDFGGWPLRQNPYTVDANWREFVGTGLVLIESEFSQYLTPELLVILKDAIVRAGQGSAIREVDPSYTNIAAMSVMLMHSASQLSTDKRLQKQALGLAQEMAKLYQSEGLFSEYNSPTYYGVDLMAFAMWRRYSKSSTLAELGAHLESRLWHDLIQMYHPGLKAFAGPAVRRYGLNERHYVSLAGLWIAVALDDLGAAPLPPIAEGLKPYEWDYLPVFAVVGVTVPSGLKQFLTNPMPHREIRRHDPFNPMIGRPMSVHSILRPTWMMGSSSFLGQPLGQRVAAAIHWKIDDQTTGWLALHGASLGEATIDKNALHVRFPVATPGNKVTIMMNTPRIAEQNIQEDVWQLERLSMRVTSHIGLPCLEFWDHDAYGRTLVLNYLIPENYDKAKDGLIIRPQFQN
jgi:hypothetical protein